jgi:hypothetical protein
LTGADDIATWNFAMKSMAQSKQVIPAFEPKAPDAIMAELWRTKQRINAEAGYDIDKLLARVKQAEQVNLGSNNSQTPQVASVNGA